MSPSQQQRVSFRMDQTREHLPDSFQSSSNSLNKSSKKDESWRKHGKQFRKQLIVQDEQQGNQFTISNQCQIERYYQVAEKVLDQFLHHPIDTKAQLLEAYLVGTRLHKFLSLVLPTHPEYQPLRIQQQLYQLHQFLEPIARLIDEQCHEAYIQSVLDTNTTEEESKVLLSLESNSILASEDSGSSDRPKQYGESKESMDSRDVLPRKHPMNSNTTWDDPPLEHSSSSRIPRHSMDPYKNTDPPLQHSSRPSRSRYRKPPRERRSSRSKSSHDDSFQYGSSARQRNNEESRGRLTPTSSLSSLRSRRNLDESLKKEKRSGRSSSQSSSRSRRDNDESLRKEKRSGRSTPSSSRSGRRSPRNQIHWEEASAESASRQAQTSAINDSRRESRARSPWDEESEAAATTSRSRRDSSRDRQSSTVNPNSTDDIQWDEESASYIILKPIKESDQDYIRSPNMDPNNETSKIDWDEESATSPPPTRTTELPPLRPPSQVSRFEEQDRQWEDIPSWDLPTKKTGRRRDSMHASSEWSNQNSTFSQWANTNLSVGSSRFEGSSKKSSQKLSRVEEQFDPWTTAIYSQQEEEKDSSSRSVMQPLESKIEKRLSKLDEKVDRRQQKSSNENFFHSLDGESPTAVPEFQDWFSPPSKTERYSKARDGRIRLRDDSLRLVDEEEEESVGGRRGGRLQPFRNCVKCLLE